MNSKSILLTHVGMELSACSYPDKKAVISGERSISFDELNRRANQVANALLGAGLKKGDKVIVYLFNCFEYPEILFGCSKAGIIVVPISFFSAPPEVEFVVNHSDAKALITSKSLSDTVQKIRHNIPNIRYVIVIDGEGPGEIDYEAWRNKASEEKPGIDIDENDIFYIGYTSGTTGNPKGYMMSHRARVLCGLAASVEFAIGPEGVNLTVAPIYHAAPIAFLLTNLYLGATVVILPTFNPVELLADIERYKITNGFFVPVMLSWITSLPDEIFNKYDLSSLKQIVSAGAALPTTTKEAVIRRFSNAELFEFYGSSEAPICTNLRHKDQMRKVNCCGKPVLGWEIKLLDKDFKEIKEPNTVGEIFAKSEYLFSGYYNNDEATKASFHDGFFSAGDMGKFDEEGYYYIVDRKKDMIVSGGINIYPAEVEVCLLKHPAVEDVAVIGIPDERWGEAVKAVVIPKEKMSVSEEDLIAFCKDKIAKYKIPKSVSFVDAMPRNPTGKILKKELRVQFAQKP